MYRQCDKLIAKTDFQFVYLNRNKRKCRVSVKTGQEFWVTSCSTMQAQYGLIAVARKSQSMHYDYSFKPEMLDVYFDNKGH